MLSPTNDAWVIVLLGPHQYLGLPVIKFSHYDTMCLVCTLPVNTVTPNNPRLLSYSLQSPLGTGLFEALASLRQFFFFYQGVSIVA